MKKIDYLIIIVIMQLFSNVSNTQNCVTKDYLKFNSKRNEKVLRNEYLSIIELDKQNRRHTYDYFRKNREYELISILSQYFVETKESTWERPDSKKYYFENYFNNNMTRYYESIGVVDSCFNMLVPPIYTGIIDGDGIAIGYKKVQNTYDEEISIINKKDWTIVDCDIVYQYFWLMPDMNSVLVKTKSGRYGVINNSGEFILDTVFYSVSIIQQANDSITFTLYSPNERDLGGGKIIFASTEFVSPNLREKINIKSFKETNRFYLIEATSRDSSLILNSFYQNILPNFKSCFLPYDGYDCYGGHDFTNSDFLIAHTDTNWKYFNLKVVNGKELLTEIQDPRFVKDIDGNRYRIVKIGKQEWMSCNLKTKTFNDSLTIPLLVEDLQWGSNKNPACCFYENDSVEYFHDYGLLYNWHAVKTAKLCPNGWHVPAEAEWLVLINYLGGKENAATKLKIDGKTEWTYIDIAGYIVGNNISKFSALPGGLRYNTGQFSNMGTHGFWWTSSENNSSQTAIQVGLLYGQPDVKIYPDNTNNGYSIRCIKD